MSDIPELFKIELEEFDCITIALALDVAVKSICATRNLSPELVEDLRVAVERVLTALDRKVLIG